MPCPTIVYHAIGGKPQNLGGGVYQHMAMPPFPRAWQRAFCLYESTWTADLSPGYALDYAALNRYLDFTEDPSRQTALQPETHSAGACEPSFTGPIMLDMERYRPAAYPAVYRAALERVLSWRPRAQWTLYGTLSKWASQWDSDAAAKMSGNDADNNAVYTRNKHVALYLKSGDAAPYWEAWNERNVAEVIRWTSKTGGRPFCGVTLHDYDGSVLTDPARMLAQVRPAIRVGADLIVWDYWFTTAERDATLPAITALQTAISTAKWELWGE